MTEERMKQIKTILQARTSAINKTWLRATLEECVTALDPAPAVDWRAVAKQAAIMLGIMAENFHDTRHSGSFKDCKISACVKSREIDDAYERALAAEAGDEQGD